MNESFYRKVRRADTTAKWTIMSIGIGIIGLVITILLVIASVAAPLFRPAAIRPASETAPGGRPGLLAAGMDEYLQNAYGIDADATLHFTPLATNATARTESLKRDTQLLAAERTGPDQYTLLYADGVARSMRVNFPTRFDAATQAPIVQPEVVTLAEIPGPTNTVPRRAIIAEAGAGSLRIDLTGDANLSIRFREEKKNLLGKVKVTESAAALTNLSSAAVVSWVYSPEFQDLYLGTAAGRLLRVDLRDPAAPVVAEDIAASPDGASITALGLAFGQVSVAVGDAAGRVATYNRVRLDGPKSVPRLHRVHELGRHAAPVKLLLPSGRDKTVYSLAADGSLQGNHLTSGRNLFSLPAREGVTTFAVSRRGERVLRLEADGGADLWAVDAPHPEVSTRVLFGKVWYEGATTNPRTSGSPPAAPTTSSPSSSLTPLILGTLKGALYSLLFAIPARHPGRACTSSAVHEPRRLRQHIKPAVEIMAALPSVVIGFLAGLWLAPLLEDKYCPASFLAPFLIVPLVVWLGHVAWSAPCRLRPCAACATLDRGLGDRCPRSPVVLRGGMGLSSDAGRVALNRRSPSAATSASG
jgi:phosphate transport system permease protein